MSRRILADHEIQVGPTLDALADGINEAHVDAMGRGLNSARRCGELLRIAKARVGHGAWLGWVRDHLKVGAHQASQYMLLSRRLDRLDPNRTRASDLDDVSMRAALALLAAALSGPALEERPPAPVQVRLEAPASSYLPALAAKAKDEPHLSRLANARAKLVAAKRSKRAAERQIVEAEAEIIAVEKEVALAVAHEMGVDVRPAVVVGFTVGLSFAYYTKTAPSEDLKAFLRNTSTTLSEELRDEAEALLVRTPGLKQHDFYREYRRLQDAWRRESNARERQAHLDAGEIIVHDRWTTPLWRPRCSEPTTSDDDGQRKSKAETVFPTTITVPMMRKENEKPDMSTPNTE